MKLFPEFYILSGRIFKKNFQSCSLILLNNNKYSCYYGEIVYKLFWLIQIFLYFCIC